jgi:hypothetical protein
MIIKDGKTVLEPIKLSPKAVEQIKQEFIKPSPFDFSKLKKRRKF